MFLDEIVMIKKIKKIVNYLRLNLLSSFRKIKIKITINKKNVEHFKINYKCKKKWYGSSYGGFFINPDLINEKSIVYSFGIGKDITFDSKIIKKHQASVFGFDPTPKSIEYINEIKLGDKFCFFPFGISTKSQTEDFFLAKGKGVSGSVVVSDCVDDKNVIKVVMKTLSDIAAELGHSKIDVLKIDIEGLEYDVIESILDSKIIIKQLLVEFHDRIFSTEEIKSKETVKLLYSYGFKIFGVSNSFEEISFINTNI